MQGVNCGREGDQMIRYLFAAVVAALVLAAAASAVAPPVMDDGGSAGSTCRWNPYWRVTCGLTSCWWVGRFEWYDPSGYPTGNACA